jgi:hypothetical protein
MEQLFDIPFDIDVTALLQKVHIEDGTDDALQIEALVRSAQKVVRPKAVYASSGVEIVNRSTVRLAGAVFRSRVLRVLLEKMSRAFPFICTCGSELDRIELPAGDIMMPFWLDSIKEMALRAALDHLKGHVQGKHGFDQVSSMSPGAGSTQLWPIEDQRALFSLFGDTQALMGVSLTESCLMLPNKTVSGVLFPSRIKFESCQLCTMEKCSERRAPYDQGLWDSFHEENA